MSSKSSTDSYLRINKFIATCDICSRRAAEKLVLDGKIKVNGKTVRDLSFKVDIHNDLVIYNNQLLTLTSKLELFAFYKPRGVISTFQDHKDRKCLQDFTRKLDSRVFAVGRLDADVNGLLLLTNDGDYCHSILHPKFEIPRGYIALVKNKPNKSHFEELKAGVKLNDGMGKAINAGYVNTSDAFLIDLFGKDLNRNYLIYLSVAEGRKHFVKRILHKVDLEVSMLSRVEYGNYNLNSLFNQGLRKGEIWKIKK